VRTLQLAVWFSSNCRVFLTSFYTTKTDFCAAFEIYKDPILFFSDVQVSKFARKKSTRVLVCNFSYFSYVIIILYRYNIIITTIIVII